MKAVDIGELNVNFQPGLDQIKNLFSRFSTVNCIVSCDILESWPVYDNGDKKFMWSIISLIKKFLPTEKQVL